MLTLLAPVVGLLFVPPKPNVEVELSKGRTLSDAETNQLSTSWWASDDLDPYIVTNWERSRGRFSATRERWEAAGFVPPAKPIPVEEEPADVSTGAAPKKRGPGRPRKERPEGSADAPKKRGPRIEDPDGAGRGKQQSNKLYRWTALVDALAGALGTTHAALVADWVEAGALALLASLPAEAQARVQADTEAAVAARRKELQDAAAPEPSDEAPAEEVPVSDETTPEPAPEPAPKPTPPEAPEAPPEPTPTPEEPAADTNILAAAGVDVPPPPPATGPSPRKAPTKGKGKK